MLDVALFVEDRTHRLVVGTLVRRLAEENGFSPSLNWRNSAHGFGRVAASFAEFAGQVLPSGAGYPDLVVVATDSNCWGHARRKRALARIQIWTPIVHAVPDPHIERWLLLDSNAFKAVFGTGCRAPDLKCDRDRYKQQLERAVRDSGRVTAVEGGDYARELASRMDIDRIARMDKSFGLFVRDMRAALRGRSEA